MVFEHDKLNAVGPVLLSHQYGGLTRLDLKKYLGRVRCVATSVLYANQLFGTSWGGAGCGCDAEGMF